MTGGKMISKIYSSVERNMFSSRYDQCPSQTPWTPLPPGLTPGLPLQTSEGFPWQLKDPCPSTVMGDARKFKSQLHPTPIPRAALNHELMRIGG